jgi:uncharacterized protein YukE
MTAPAPAPLGGAVLPVLARIQDGLVEAENLVNRIVTAAAHELDQLPGWLVGDSRTLLADLQRTAAEAIAQVRGWLATAGDPIALELAASGWIEEVGGPVSGLVPLGAAERPELNSSWTGDAAEAYVAVLPAQGTALEAIQDTAGDARAALTEFANAIRSFWAGIDNAILTAEAGLATAVGTAITGPGAILGVLFALGTVAACAVALGQEWSAFNTFTGDAANHGGELNTRVHDNAAFGNAEWPRSTTHLFADGSTSDGDDSDWHVG